MPFTSFRSFLSSHLQFYNSQFHPPMCRWPHPSYTFLWCARSNKEQSGQYLDKNETLLSLAQPYLSWGPTDRISNKNGYPKMSNFFPHNNWTSYFWSVRTWISEYERASKQMLIIIVITKHYLVLENTSTKVKYRQKTTDKVIEKV